MNAITQIEQLWRYLKIQDNEILIVPNYNKETGVNEYFCVKCVNNNIDISVLDHLPEMKSGMSFRIIKQLDSSGHYIIPSVNQIKHDRHADYDLS